MPLCRTKWNDEKMTLINITINANPNVTRKELLAKLQAAYPQHFNNVTYYALKHQLSRYNKRKNTPNSKKQPQVAMDDKMTAMQQKMAQYEAKINDNVTQNEPTTVKLFNGIATKRRLMKQDLIFEFYDELYPSEGWWITDRPVPNECEVKRRPDRMNEFESHILILEVDEQQHKKYPEIVEIKRMRELWLANKEKPIVVIRFNPDQYVDKEKHKIPSCFGKNNDGQWEMCRKSMKDRLVMLNLQVRRCSHFANIAHCFANIKPGDTKVYQLCLFFDHHDCLC